MCTIGYLRKAGIMFKNRDKAAPEVEEIINDGNIMACKTVGDKHYSWGLNKHGCGFVTAMVQSKFWPGDRDKYKEGELKLPSLMLTETLPEVTGLGQWIEILKQKGPWQGYNVILADREGAMLVEMYGENIEVSTCGSVKVVTNHFCDVEYADKEGYKTGHMSTFERYDYAAGRLKGIEHPSREELQAVLLPNDMGADPGIWMTDASGGLVTVSSNIIDIRNLTLYYATEPGGRWKMDTIGN